MSLYVHILYVHAEKLMMLQACRYIHIRINKNSGLKVNADQQICWGPYSSHNSWPAALIENILNFK